MFPGLSILRKDKPFSIEDRRPSTRANGWDLYDKNRLDSALQAWGNGGGIHLADLCNYVCHILHEHGIEFIRAPYSAWAQVTSVCARAMESESANIQFHIACLHVYSSQTNRQRCIWWHRIIDV